MLSFNYWCQSCVTIYYIFVFPKTKMTIARIDLSVFAESFRNVRYHSFSLLHISEVNAPRNVPQACHWTRNQWGREWWLSSMRSLDLLLNYKYDSPRKILQNARRQNVLICRLKYFKRKETSYFAGSETTYVQMFIIIILWLRAHHKNWHLFNCNYKVIVCSQ